MWLGVKLPWVQSRVPKNKRCLVTGRHKVGLQVLGMVAPQDWALSDQGAGGTESSGEGPEVVLGWDAQAAFAGLRCRVVQAHDLEDLQPMLATCWGRHGPAAPSTHCFEKVLPPGSSGLGQGEAGACLPVGPYL